MQRLSHDRVTRRVDAGPGQIYDLVSDVTKTPQWSPEVIECHWLEGATGAAPGARFQARNQRRWFTWSNKPVVETADRGREFAITRTEPGGGTIRWSYQLQPDEHGTTVVHGYQVLRPVPIALHLILRLFLGVKDLQADLHANIEASLARLARIAEQHAREQDSDDASSPTAADT